MVISWSTWDLRNAGSPRMWSATEQRYKPGNDNEEVETVPAVGQIRVLSDEAHRQHLDAHLDGEVGVDGVVGDLEDLAASTRLVGARLVETERHAVQQNHRHRRPLEPRVHQLRQGNTIHERTPANPTQPKQTHRLPQYLIIRQNKYSTQF